MNDWFPIQAECPACASRAITPHFRMTYWQKYPLEFHLCTNCGARFANPMPGNAIITRGNNALVQYYQRGREFGHEFRDARQAYLRGKLLARKLHRWKTHGRLLEVGCYNGFFLAGIREHCDWEVEGVEIAAHLTRFAKEKLGLTMHTGVLEELALASDDYDFIVFNDLIEHITQPKLFLREIARLLAPGGRLQLITPNASQDTAFAKRAFDSGKPLNILLNHIMFFSPRSVRFALENAGLRIRRLYSYDIRYSLKDYGVFGLGKVGEIGPSPSFEEVEKLRVQDPLREWTPARLQELRNHSKVSYAYGFIKEILPGFFRVRVPEFLGIGHEIFAQAEKPPRAIAALSAGPVSRAPDRGASR